MGLASDFYFFLLNLVNALDSDFIWLRLTIDRALTLSLINQQDPPPRASGNLREGLGVDSADWLSGALAH